jgi:excisionase family DNA binding protein
MSELERLAVQVKEAAYLLGVSETTIRNLVKQGKLESVKVGGEQRATRLIKYASLKKLLGMEEAA